jgi:hypothetical protein
MSADLLTGKDQKEHSLLMAQLLERYARAIRRGAYQSASLNRTRNVQRYHSWTGSMGLVSHGMTWEMNAVTPLGNITVVVTESEKQYQRAQNRKRVKS